MELQLINKIMTDVKYYAAKEKVDIKFNPFSTGKNVKIMWWDNLNNLLSLASEEIVDLP